MLDKGIEEPGSASESFVEGFHDFPRVNFMFHFSLQSRGGIDSTLLCPGCFVA